jgi:amino acid permease
MPRIEEQARIFLRTRNDMNENWQWVGRYVAVILIAVILAASLGSMNLFESTKLGTKLTAAHIVQFLGFGAGLAVFWLLGQRASIEFRKQGGKWEFLRHIVLPLVTLIVVASAHGVILLVLRTLMDAEQRNLYNWLFIGGIIAAAAWLVVALFNQSSSLTQAVTSAAQRSEPGSAAACPHCGARTEAGAHFCSRCGGSLGG